MRARSARIRKFLSHANALRPYIYRQRLTRASDVAEEIKRVMLADGLSNATVNLRLALLRRVCRLAYAEWAWLDKPILIRLLPERNERHVYLTPDELRPSAEYARIRRSPTCAGSRGLRRGEPSRSGAVTPSRVNNTVTAMPEPKSRA